MKLKPRNYLKTFRKSVFVSVFTLSLSLSLSLSSFGQIKVNADGKVGIGTLTPETGTSLTIEGNTCFRQSGASEPSLWVHLSQNYLGLMPHPDRYTTLGDLVCEWDEAYIKYITSYEVWSDYIYSYQIDCFEFNNYSDKKIKKNIAALPDFSSQIMRLKPISFQFIDSLEITKGDKKSYKQLPQDVQYGFLAQDLKEVFPEMVTTNKKNGFLQISTLDLIAVLVKGFQEQQLKIETLENRIAQLESGYVNTKSGKMEAEAVVMNNITIESSLSQNIPNPFTENTLIPYSIGKDVQNAVMYVFDMNGKMLNTYQLEHGTTELKISGSTYQPGMYIYTLVCDGKEVDTKRMILTN